MILVYASSLEVCCFCHAANVSISRLLLHGSQGLSIAGANGLERKSHILGCVAHSAEWCLIMKSADDDWEEPRISTFCNASFGTRCFGGYKVKLTGTRGSSILIEWASRLQGPQSMSSTECVKEALDAVRLKPVPCDGYVGNDALRLAAGRGSSAKLRHVRVHAETCFRFVAQLPISLHRVGTTEIRGRHHDQGSLCGAIWTQYLWPAL